MKAIKITLIIVLSLAILRLFFTSFLWQKYTNKEYGFSILLPRLWYKQEGFSGAVIMASSSQENPADRFRENISVVVSPAPTDMKLTTYFEMNKNEVFQTLPGEEFGIEEGEISAAGNLGRWLSFSVQGKDIVLRITSAIWVKNNRAYVITCTSQDSQYYKYEPVFKKSLQSLRIR